MDGTSFTQLIFTFAPAAVFFWMFALGGFFVTLCFIMGEALDGLGDIFHGALDMLHLDSIFHIDADGGGGPSIFSPRVISVFVTIFGAGGFFSTLGGINVIGSSLIGLIAGFSVASVFFFIFRWIYSQQTSSVVNTQQLVGMSGVVRTEIPVGGLGEVIVDFAGLRMTRSAKSEDGKKIPTNANIKVKEVSGHIIIVSVA